MTLYIRDQISVDVTELDERAKAKLRKDIESLLNDAASTGEPESAAPEAPAILDEVLMRLVKEGAAVQHAAIKATIDEGGAKITREEVYQLGKYATDRSLRGFTRPVRRVLKQMAAEGLVPETAPDKFFRATYDPALKGFRPTTGFRVDVGALVLS